jgi:hypothetical protein
MARTPRIPKSGQRRPERAEIQRQLWQDGQHRAKMIAARRRSAEARRQNPERYSRLGVPNGMHRAEAQALWTEAQSQADSAIKGLEAQGIVSAVVVPDSDEAKAKAALHGACVLALGPGNARDKLQALNVVLTFTKPRAGRHAIAAAVSPEDWLLSVLASERLARQCP